MQLEVSNFKEMSEIEFNYDILKNELKSKLDRYNGKVYAENDIAIAKSDRADINKVAKMLDEKRLEIKKMYMKPFEDFEKKVKELVTMAKDTANMIGVQLNEFEEARKTERLEEVKSLIDEISDGYSFDFLFDEKYLKKTCSDNDIKKDVTQKVEKINEDLQFLKDRNLGSEDLLKDTYFKHNGNVLEAIKYLEELNKHLEEINKVVVEQKIPQSQNEELNEYTLTLFATENQFKAIKEFLRDNGIKSL